MQQHKDIEEARFMILWKTMTLDKSDSSQVQAINELLESYFNIQNPEARKVKKTNAQEKTELLESFKKSFPKIKSRMSKAK